MLMLAANITHAADYDYLVFQQSDGNKTSIASENLIITFSDGYLIATASDGTTTRLLLSGMDSMWFSATQAGVVALSCNADASVKLSDRILYITANRGDRYVVSNAAGMVISQGEASGMSDQAVSEQLTEGLYIVKVGSKSTKILVR